LFCKKELFLIKKYNFMYNKHDCARITNTNSYFSISIKQNSLRVDNYYDATLKIACIVF